MDATYSLGQAGQTSFVEETTLPLSQGASPKVLNEQAEPPEFLFYHGPTAGEAARGIIAKVMLSDIEKGKPSFIQSELAATLASGFFSRQDIVKANATESIKDKKIFNEIRNLNPEFVNMSSILKEMKKNNLIIPENPTRETLMQLGFQAVEHGCTNLLRCLLRLNLVDSFAVNQQGNSMLICAIHSLKYNQDIVHLLINSGANVNFPDKENKTPLIIAAGRGHEELVQLLIAQGANLDAKDSKGRTALMVAAFNLPYEALGNGVQTSGILTWKALIQAGANRNIQIQDTCDNTAFLHAMRVASEYPQIDIIELINELTPTAEHLTQALKQMIQYRNPSDFNNKQMAIINFLIDKDARLTLQDHRELSKNQDSTVRETYKQAKKLLDKKAKT